MVDAALTDELRVSALIAHVKAQNPSRQLIAEPRMSAGGESIYRLGALRLLRCAEPGIAVLISMFRRHAAHIEEAHLFGLQVGCGGPFRERIQVVVPEALARAALGAR